VKNGEFSSISAMFTFLAVYSKTVYQRGTLLTVFFFSKGASQVYHFFHFQMLCFVACHRTAHCLCSWHDCSANT